jgi:DNA recombination-dependent growth factor C
MGVYSGSASYVRYKVNGDLPASLKEAVLTKLKEFSFQEPDQPVPREKSIGWVSAENMASIFFDDLHFSKGQYLVFSLRIDTRKVPPLAFKAALLKEELKFKRSTGKERLSIKDKEKLKDQVKLALMKRALPAPALYDVCWNTATGMLLFFSTSKTANAEFVDFFFASFELSLTPLSPYERAQFLIEKHGGKIKIDKLSKPAAGFDWSAIKEAV